MPKGKLAVTSGIQFLNKVNHSCLHIKTPQKIILLYNDLYLPQGGTCPPPILVKCLPGVPIQGNIGGEKKINYCWCPQQTVCNPGAPMHFTALQ